MSEGSEVLMATSQLLKWGSTSDFTTISLTLDVEQAETLSMLRLHSRNLIISSKCIDNQYNTFYYVTVFKVAIIWFQFKYMDIVQQDC